MQTTPSKAGLKIDQIIDRLNSTWNLEIERLHGNDAKRANRSSALEKRCAARIRVLCWRGGADVDKVIDDFEESIAQRY